MIKNKQIIKNCPNFYKIINFEYYEDDIITEKLMVIYKKFIFSADINNEEEIEKVRQIDQLLNKYINDYNFRREMKISLPKIEIKRSNNLLLSVVNGLLNIFDAYQEGTTQRIYISKWI